MRVKAILSAFTTRDVLDREASKRVLHLIHKYGYGLRKISYAEGDNVRIPCNNEVFNELWTGHARPGGYSGGYWTASLFARGTRGLSDLRWHGFVTPHRIETPCLTLTIHSQSFLGLARGKVSQVMENLARLGHEICVSLGATFGYVSPMAEDGDSRSLEKSGDEKLGTMMPCIHWRTFVGSPWLECVRERAHGVEHLDQEESEGVLALKMDADPLSPAVLQGSLASKLMEVLRRQLFVPGALPQVSYSELEDKARSAVLSPPEATVDAVWRSSISAELRKRPIEDVISALAQRGEEISDGFTLGVSPEDTLDDLGGAIRADFRGARPAVPRDEMVTALGAYCGELMRGDLGGVWDINPRFPGNPGLRKGQMWVYPLGVMDQALSRVADQGPWPEEYYRALREVECDCEDSSAFSQADSARRSSVANTAPHNTLGERLVEYARRHHGLELDYSLQGLQLLDGMALELYRYAGRDLEIFTSVRDYLGETIRRSAGGEWVITPLGRPAVRVPSSRGTDIQVDTHHWIFDRVFRGMYASFPMKAKGYIPSSDDR